MSSLSSAQGKKRLLFLIRDKLGDSLIAWSGVKAYLNTHPQDLVTVIMRKDYAYLLQAEKGFELVPYASWPAMYLRLVLWRILGRRFDALVVLRGFGWKVPAMGRLVRATRKLCQHGRFADVYPEFPPQQAVPTEKDLLEHSFAVIRLLDATIPKPRSLDVPSLRERYAGTPKDLIVICPVSDERRRTLDMADIRVLAPHLAKANPATRVVVLVRSASELIGAAEKDDPEIVAFGDLKTLLAYFFRSHRYYGVDTGLYHIAAAMGMPAVVFFGPTQPHLNMMPEQSHALGVRMSALGRRHCDEKTCQRPVCQSQAIRNYVGDRETDPSAMVLPDACPLRSIEKTEWLHNDA